MVWIYLAVRGDQGGCCDNGNEPLGCINDNKCISLVRDCWRLMEPALYPYKSISRQLLYHFTYFVYCYYLYLFFVTSVFFQNYYNNVYVYESHLTSKSRHLQHQLHTSKDINTAFIYFVYLIYFYANIVVHSLRMTHKGSKRIRVLVL